MGREPNDRDQIISALQESERRLSTLMDSLPGMAYRTLNDPNWTMEFASKGCKDLLGYDNDYLINNPGKNRFEHRCHPDDLEWVKAKVYEAAEKDELFDLIYRTKTASGEYKWVWEKGKGVLSPSGRLVATEGFVTDFTNHKQAELELRREIERLRHSMKERFRLGDIIGKSQAMQEVYELILKAANTNVSVLIQGESGTGKELAARAIHDLSLRRGRPFLPVNCGAIPETLMESEFFGHRRGAFTGAVSNHPGYLETAGGGTLFLDELGEIGPGLQVKLLRVLDGYGYSPVGGKEIKKADVRIIASTNRDLRAMVADGGMREDFYYRIHVLPIKLPPLRERREDIPLLIDRFLKADSPEGSSPMVPSMVREQLRNHDWPGNVRELQNVLYRYLTLKRIDFTDAPTPLPRLQPQTAPEPEQTGGRDLKSLLRSYERRVLVSTLNKHRWHRGQTAAALNINRKTLFKKMKDHGLLAVDDDK